MLVKFLYDLVYDEKAQRTFAESPTRALELAGLPSHHQELFAQGAVDALENAVREEMNQLNPAILLKGATLNAKQLAALERRDARAYILELLEEAESLPVTGFWFKPTVSLQSISPSSGRPGENLQVELTGSYFSEDMTAQIENNTNQVPIKIEGVGGAGQESSTAKGTLDLPSTLPTGEYTVSVQSDGETSTLPLGFTVSNSVAVGSAG